jgi:hypothetical protein
MSIEHERRLNREKQRRFRARHAAERLVAAESRRVGRRGRAPLHRCVEITDQEGIPLRVFVARVDEPVALKPGESISSRWLPGRPVSLKVAKMLVAARIACIARWCGQEPDGGSL